MKELWFLDVLDILQEKTKMGGECKALVLAEKVTHKRFVELKNLCPDIFCKFKVHWMDKKIFVAADSSPAHERTLGMVRESIMNAAGMGVLQTVGQAHIFNPGRVSIGADESFRIAGNVLNAANNDGRGRTCPVIFIEVHVSRELQHLHDICSTLAAIPSVNLVIGVKFLKKTVANDYRAVYYEYDGTVNPAVPSTAVSFGTLSLTQGNINKIARITGIDQANIQGHVLGLGPITAANPHQVTIPWALIYTNTVGIVVPAGNINFTLFELQQEIRAEDFGSI